MIRQKLLGIVRYFLLDRYANNRSLEELGQELATGGEAMERKLDTFPDTPANRDQLRHIIAIERWATARLRSALGEEGARLSSDDFLPPAEATWEELRATFRESRAASRAVSQQLAEAKVARSQLIEHDDFGAMSPHSWLRYIHSHASAEMRRFKSA